MLLFIRVPVDIINSVNYVSYTFVGSFVIWDFHIKLDIYIFHFIHSLKSHVSTRRKKLKHKQPTLCYNNQFSILSVPSRMKMCVYCIFYCRRKKKISLYNLEKNLDIRLLPISAILHSLIIHQ